MKAIDEIISDYHPIITQQETLYTHEQVRAMLAAYGSEVVDECAGSFECTMETVHVPGAENEVQQQPVLVRASILEVKNKIK